MTVKSNTDAAIADLKTELDTMEFLSDMEKDNVDEELIYEIQADLDSLVSGHNATFKTSWGGVEHTPTAEEIAHWLFDGVDPGLHRLTIELRPTNSDEVLSYTTDVPIPAS
jgi:hypothetical protein